MNQGGDMADTAADAAAALVAWAGSGRNTIAAVLAVLLVSGTAAGWARRRIQGVAARTGDNEATAALVSAARTLLLALGGLLALAIAGVSTTGIALAGGALLIAAAIALQALARDASAGLLLQTLRPLAAGDVVETDGLSGRVSRLGLFATTLQADDGVFVSVPNGQLWGRTIRNLSRLPTRRLEIAVSIGYEHDADEVLAVCRDLVEMHGRVMRDPPPEVVVSALRESCMVITIRVWTSGHLQRDVLFQLNRDIKKTLDTAGIHAGIQPQPLRPAPFGGTASLPAGFRARVLSRVAAEP
jgi:small conductance mechanosensitive channel